MPLDSFRSRSVSALALALPVVAVLSGLFACHSHDDDGVGSGGAPGTGGGLDLAPTTSGVRAGEVEDFAATLPGGGVAEITSWDLTAGPGGELVDLGVPGSVRLVADGVGTYGLRATDTAGRTGALTFDVASAAAALTVTEQVPGDDFDAVEARFDAAGADLYIADRIGGGGASQRLARASLSGERDAEVSRQEKILDIAAFGAGGCVALAPASTLPGAILRFDRDLVELPAFAAPDLGPGAAWAPRVAIDRRAGAIVIATSLNGGALLYLDASGAPANGTVQSSLVPAPFVTVSEVVDLAVDADGAVYVAAEDAISRVLPDGTIDSLNWTPPTLSNVVSIASDENGVLLVLARDQNAGQTGSLRRLDWLGSELGILTEFSAGSFFAPRQFIAPLDVTAYADGSWRVYDDTQALDPASAFAAWIVAGDLPAEGDAGE